MTVAPIMKEHRMSLHCREPRLEEILADPIVKAVMEADGVDLRELVAELQQTATLLRAMRELRASRWLNPDPHP